MTPDTTPDVKHEYLAAFCGGKESLWCIVLARSAQELVDKYPLLIVARERPAGLTDEFVSQVRSDAFDIDGPAPAWLDIVHAPMDRRAKFVMAAVAVLCGLGMALIIALLIFGGAYVTTDGAELSWAPFSRTFLIILGPCVLVAVYWVYDNSRMMRRIAFEEALKSDQERPPSAKPPMRGFLARTFRPYATTHAHATLAERIGFKLWSIARGLSLWMAALIFFVLLVGSLKSSGPVAPSVVIIGIPAVALAPSLVIWAVGRALLYVLARR